MRTIASSLINALKSGALFFIFASTSLLAKEDLIFFEDRYQVKFEGVKKKSEYKDPDSFYSAIAAKLGIGKIAFKAVSKKLGWKKNPTKKHQGIIRRMDHRWVVMLFQIEIDPDTRKPIMGTMKTHWAAINDDKKVIYLGGKQPTEEDLRAQPQE